MDKQRDFEKGWEEYKAKKKQEQEKMIGIIQDAVGGCARNWASLIAEELLKYYQPKIPENAVVLTREEKQEYESLVKLLIYDKPINSRVYEFIKDTKDRVRKETAEKFAERLKEELENRSAVVGYDLEDLEFDGEIIQECIDEICKECTGEAK